MVVYWREKVKIFGRHDAYRRLTLDDLDERDVRAIRANSLLALPAKDTKGRGLIYSDIVQWDPEPFVMNRVAFYMAHTLLEDVAVQQRGVVLLLSFTTALSIQNFKRKVHNRVINTFRKVLPVRIVGVHVIEHSSLFSLIQPHVLHSLGPDLRRRLRMHQGSDIQVLSSLSEYGIVASNFPHHAGGALEVNMTAWMEQRQAIELLLQT
jgi:CRAL/TRIO domain